MHTDNNLKLAGAGFRGRSNFPVMEKKLTPGITFPSTNSQGPENGGPSAMTGIETSQSASEGGEHTGAPLDGTVIMHEELPLNEKLRDTIKATMVRRHTIPLIDISQLSTNNRLPGVAVTSARTRRISQTERLGYLQK
jgi:hypothetical protein